MLLPPLLCLRSVIWRFSLPSQFPPSQAQSMNKIGVVSADGATTLDGLEAKLAEKAAAAGASGYTITSANTNNKLSGTAVIYK
jgi:hypothetical protein